MSGDQHAWVATPEQFARGYLVWTPGHETPDGWVGTRAEHRAFVKLRDLPGGNVLVEIPPHRREARP